MSDQALSIRQLQITDLDLFAAYWLNSDQSYFTGMGVDVTKLPAKKNIFDYWQSQFKMPLDQRLSYCVIWERNSIPIGHSSVRPLNYGKDAYLHLHLWNNEERKRGMGFEFIKMTVAHYFEVLKLQDLYCEPYALNPAPNKVMEKAGFDFIREYITTPGPFNFEQPVKLWHLSLQKFEELYQAK
jgi:RimJ/RimL family protein N-acetyltransferase